MNAQVIQMLQQKTSLEQQQEATHHFIADLPQSAVATSGDHQAHLTLTNDYFFKYHSVYISKHNRFAPYPKHTHKFLELNYMLTGNCTEVVDGQLVKLHEGDILMMNVGCSHSINALGTNDLLINVLFRDSSITFNLLNSIHKNNSITYSFLSDISLGKHPLRNYILFPQNQDIKATMDEIIEEYFLEKSYSSRIIESYLDILLAKILRHHPLPTVKTTNRQQDLVIQCLNEIDQNYATITLEQLANKYGYNKDYLGNLIKKHTNNTFSQLKTKQRLIQANNLLQSSTLPINKIITKVGIKNKNFFYQKYHEFYGMSPAQKRADFQERHQTL